MTEVNAKKVRDIVNKIEHNTEEKARLENTCKLGSNDTADILIYDKSGFGGRGYNKRVSIPKEAFGDVVEVIANYYVRETHKLEAELEKL